MRKIYIFWFAMTMMVILLAGDVLAQITVSGSNNTDGTYASLTASGGVFSALGGVAQTGKTITVTITGNVNIEDGTTTLTDGGWTSLTIQPSGTRTISGTVAGTSMIMLSGADNVTINGLNAGGNSLTISNISTSVSTGTSTLKFVSDATNNTITNCSILGSTTVPLTTDGGVIWFSTANTGGNGNDNNTISYCNIGPAGTNLPSRLIFSLGTNSSSAIANSNITIDHCNLFDYFLTTGCAAIYALTGNTDWNITNNKVYQAATRTFTGTGTMTGIYFASANYGNNIQITGNTIGYSSSLGTGTFTLTGSSFVGAFQGIYLSALPTAATACNINNNIISNISLTSSTGTLYGIYNMTTANSNTINMDYNTIRNINMPTTTGLFYAILSGGAATLSVSSNTISNITRTGNGPVCGIAIGSGTDCTISNNSITSLSIDNLVATGPFTGIFTSGSPKNITANTNTITNLTSTSTASISIKGIFDTASGAGNKIYRNNIINNLSAAGGATIIGIHAVTTSTPNALDISGNVINTFSGGLNEYGIQQSAVTNANVYKNKIYGLLSTNASAAVYGLYISKGTSINIYNNLIGDLSATAANTTIPIAGIYASGTSGTTNNIYYNTVYLNTSSSSGLFGSSALYASTTSNLNLQNNIFVNISTPVGPTGFTSAYRRNNTTLTTYATNSNNNLFYAGTPGTKNLIMYDGTNSYQTLANYKAAVSTRDAASISENTPFASTTGSDANFFQINNGTASAAIPIVSNAGVTVSGITTDFAGNTRTSTPDIGAYEFQISRSVGANETLTPYNDYANITIDGNNPSLGGAATINGILTLTNGVLTTTSSNLLTIGSAGSVSGGSATSYINGPLAFQTAATAGPAEKTFPIGKGSKYLPLTLSVNQNAASSSTFTAEMFNSTPPANTIGSGLDNVSTVRYFNIGQTVVGSAFTAGAVTLNFDISDNVQDISKLRIARGPIAGSGTWADLGGIGTVTSTLDVYKIGNIVSNIPFTDLTNTIFVLANGNTGGNPLPVELTAFTASVKQRDVSLKWETATEVNSYSFDVERARVNTSGADSNWLKVASIKASGNSNSPKEYRYTDSRLDAGKYQYRLKMVDNDGSYKYSQTVEVSIALPKAFDLSRNYPNPFNPSTTISFALPERANVTLTIYNQLGQKTAVLLECQKEAGVHQIEWNAAGMISGVYFYELKTEKFRSAKKLILMK